MKRRILTALLLTGVWAQAAELAPPDKALVIKLAKGQDAAQVAKNVAAGEFAKLGGLGVILKDWNLTTVEPVFCRGGREPRDPERFKALGLDRYLVAGWKPKSAPPPAYVRKEITGQLRALDIVEEAVLNPRGRGHMIPDDPKYILQWHHPRIHSPEAWDLATGTPDILIAVVDSGLCPGNDDLDYGLISNGWDYVEGDAVPQDEHGHGTYVTGIIAAQTSNDTMVAGLAWNCRILAIRVLDADNWGLYTDWAAAIEEAADAGADIINTSFGGPESLSFLSNACEYADGLDAILVASMGNSDTDEVLYPAAYGCTIAVGATDRQDRRSSHAIWGSNFGPHLDVTAPGSDILSTVENHVGFAWGTSMAAPMVSSLAALIKEVRPEFSSAVVRAFILGTAEDGVGDPAEDTPGYDIFMGYGRIRFDSALELAAASIPCTLTTVTAAAPPPAAKKMLAPFVWLRDRQLAQTPLGRKLAADYYAASKTVAPVVGRDPELMVRILACVLDYGPVIEMLRKNPASTVALPEALWKESCAIAGDLLPKLDAPARKQLEPWLARGKKDPVGLLKELGISAVLKDMKP